MSFKYLLYFKKYKHFFSKFNKLLCFKDTLKYIFSLYIYIYIYIYIFNF